MEKRICQWCKKEFFLYPSAIRQGKGTYCSKKCSGFARNKQITKECSICHKIFKVGQSRIKRNEGNFCSIKCRGLKHSEFMKGKIPWNKGKKGLQIAWNKGTKGIIKPNSGSFKKGHKGLRGEDHPQWKGGKRTHMGYWAVVHPTFRYKNGAFKYVFEHRLIMEKHLGRELLSNEIVHHKNGIKSDNRIENLEIVIRKSHFGQVTCPHCLKEFSIK